MKKLLPFAFLFLFVAAAGQVPGFEYVGRIGTHSYYLQKDAVHGSDIDSVLQAFKTRSGIAKAYAAVINNLEENDSVTRMVQRTNNKHFVLPFAPKNEWSDLRNVWIGLSDRDQEGSFKWLNGDTSTYRNWATGEPNSFPPDEDYVQLLLMEGLFGKWNDWSQSPLPLLIETESHQVLAVSSLSLRAVKTVDGIALFASTAGVIERSTDGKSFYSISRNAVTMVDRFPEEMNYYRLRVGSSLSPVVAVRYNPIVYKVYNHLGQLVTRTAAVGVYRSAGAIITR